MEQRLLNLTMEYADAKNASHWGEEVSHEPHRAPEDIAAEYGRVLRAFLSK